MTDLIFSLALVAGLFLSLLAIVVGILVNPRSGLPKWIMAASCIFLLVGFSGLGTIIVMEQWNVLDWIPEEPLWDFTFVSLFFSAALFAVGFFWDRIRRSKSPTH